MRVHVPTVLEGHEWAMPLDPTEFDTFFALDGTPVSDWDPPYMQFLHTDDTGLPYRRSDFPWLGEHVFLLRPKAQQALHAVLDSYGEVVPLRCKEPLWLFNATNAIDALDEARSEIVRFDDGGVLAIEKHVFDASVIGDSEIFKLPGRASSIYVTDAFVARIRDAGLSGVAFRPVWSDLPVEDSQIIAFPSPAEPAKAGLATRLKAGIGRLIGSGPR